MLGVGLYALCTDRQAQFEAKLSELESLNYRYLALQDHNARMKDRIEFLKTDEGVEEVVREKLGLVRPGELAYSVVPPPPPQFSNYDSVDIYPLSEDELEALLEDKGAVIKLLRHLFSENEPETVAGESL